MIFIMIFVVYFQLAKDQAKDVMHFGILWLELLFKKQPDLFDSKEIKGEFFNEVS